jgi:hypothetical protein
MIDTNDGDALRITMYALEKAKAYARAIDQECSGFLLRKQNTPLVVTDVSLAQAESDGAYFHINALATIEAMDAIDANGKEAIGYWHSHARHGVFHSHIDANETEPALERFAPNTLEMVKEQYHPDTESTADGFIVSTPTLEILLDKADSLKCVKALRSIARVYSLVVNAAGDHYAEVISKEYCRTCKSKIVYPAHTTEVKIIDSEVKLDLDAIVAESKSKVRTLESRKAPVKPKISKRGIIEDFAQKFTGTYRAGKYEDAAKLIKKYADELGD